MMDLLQAEQGVDGSTLLPPCSAAAGKSAGGEDDPAEPLISGRVAGRSVAVRHKSHTITTCGRTDHGSLIALIKP
jgi:hypothetical protein